MNNQIATVALALSVCLVGASKVLGVSNKMTEPGLTVTLVDADKKAQMKSATVSVQVRGLQLIDSALVKEKPAKGQGHLHYRLDRGPIIATTATKLSFHELVSGPHSFTVNLAANDHSPLGPSQTVNITVP
jgi:hypothetical protein